MINIDETSLLDYLSLDHQERSPSRLSDRHRGHDVRELVEAGAGALDEAGIDMRLLHRHRGEQRVEGKQGPAVLLVEGDSHDHLLRTRRLEGVVEADLPVG